MHSNRIGFTLASIHLGSSESLWTSLSEHVQKTDDSLFIFPLGRLECEEENEAMRASVVPLVNKKNVDGLISWASALGGVVSQDEVINFHKENFDDLSYVTIGLKCPGHAEISFDAYSGFKSAVDHLIKVHKLKRLAFIRGPENHQSAEDRFRAYLDSLKENGIDVDYALISSPFSWSQGDDAIRELCEKRLLRPGIDFDALCSSSDMMMLSAGRYLERKGIRIPKDVKLVGFNNSAESRLLRVACTTVQMPYERVGVMAYTLIKGILNSQASSFECPDVMLPAELIIRRSCGCHDSFGGLDTAKEVIKDKASFKEWANKTFKFKDDEGTLFERVLNLSFAFPLLDDEKEDFIYACSELFERLLERDIDVNLIYEAIEWSLLINDNEDYKSLVNTRLLRLVGTSLGRVDLLKEFSRIERDKILNRFKCELLSLKSFSALSLSLQKYLPSLKVDAAFVVLKTESLKSRLVAGFDGSVLYDEAMEFEDDLLLPSSINSNLPNGVYIVSSLFSDNTDLGYLVLRVKGADGPLAEELRTSLSSAVQGTYLLESSNKARIYAENAEKERNEFFSNVSEDLRDPLLRIKELISSDNFDDESKKSIRRLVEGANHMIDLSLAQTGELEIEKSLVSLSEIARDLGNKYSIKVSEDNNIPLIYFDPERLKEAVELLINLTIQNSGSLTLKLSLRKDSVVLELDNVANKLDYTLLLNDSSYLLCERIMVIHQGSLRAGLGCVVLSFSLPTFSLESARIKDKALLNLADESCVRSFYAEEISKEQSLKRKGLYDSISAISWSISDSSYDTLSLLRKLSRESSLSRVPLYLFGSVSSSFSPISLIDHQIKDFEIPPVLLLGPLPEQMKKVLAEKNIIELKSFDEYERSDPEKMAKLLIITKEVDAKDIAEFRRAFNLSFNIIVMLGSFSYSYAYSLCSIPKLILVNNCIAESDDFIYRFNSILSGSDILPSFTGAIVKKALGYLVEHATSQITRWQLAESVNVSEDYLTRIFRKELGISPWDYLNRYRIYLASGLLTQETMSVNEVAYKTGFQDQAYFCRVFKKIKGVTPGKLRSRN